METVGTQESQVRRDLTQDHASEETVRRLGLLETRRVWVPVESRWMSPPSPWPTPAPPLGPKHSGLRELPFFTCSCL